MYQLFTLKWGQYYEEILLRCSRGKRLAYAFPAGTDVPSLCIGVMCESTEVASRVEVDSPLIRLWVSKEDSKRSKMGCVRIGRLASQSTRFQPTMLILCHRLDVCKQTLMRSWAPPVWRELPKRYSSPVCKLVPKGDPVFLYQYLEENECEKKQQTHKNIQQGIPILILIQALTSNFASVCGSYHEALDGTIVGVHEQRPQGADLGCSVPSIWTVNQHTGSFHCHCLQDKNVGRQPKENGSWQLLCRMN